MYISRSLSAAFVSLYFLQVGTVLVHGAALIPREEPPSSKFGFYEVSMFPDWLQKVLIPAEEGQCNMVVQAKTRGLLGTKVFGFPACRQKSSESPASVSWPQPMPTRFTDFNEEWGKDIYIVKGFPADAREKEDLKGTSVSKLSWDDMANKVAKEIPLTKPTDLTYSSAPFTTLLGQLGKPRQFAGPWLNPYTHLTGETLCKDAADLNKCLDDDSNRAYINAL